ncbi:MAG: hypothetical protein ACRELG_08265, partial [Gemmataceae bacterium]
MERYIVIPGGSSGLQSLPASNARCSTYILTKAQIASIALFLHGERRELSEPGTLTAYSAALRA